MKKILSLLLLLFFSENGSAQDPINLLFYNVNVNTDIISDLIEVELQLDINVEKESKQLQFIFSSNSAIRSIDIKKNKDWLPAAFMFNGNDSLLVTYSNGLDKGANYTLKFKYSFPADRVNDYMLYIDRGHRWYPLVMDQVVPFRITTLVPSGYSVISAGNLAGENNSVFIWESITPVFKIPLIIFNDNAYKKVSRGIVDLYYSRISTGEADNILSIVNNVMGYYTGSIGPYRYNKLILFETENFTGINTCSGLLMAGLQSLQAAGKGYDNMLVVTLAQQWFGAGVYGKFGGEGFFILTFSLPNYLRLMYERKENGVEEYNKLMIEHLGEYQKYANTERDVPIIKIDVPNTREKGIILYAKGPYLLHLIENSLGPEKWNDMLRKLYKNNYGSVIDLSLFKQYLSDYDEDGSTLNLFNKLINEKGMPVNN